MTSFWCCIWGPLAMSLRLNSPPRLMLKCRHHLLIKIDNKDKQFRVQLVFGHTQFFMDFKELPSLESSTSFSIQYRNMVVLKASSRRRERALWKDSIAASVFPATA